MAWTAEELVVKRVYSEEVIGRMPRGRPRKRWTDNFSYEPNAYYINTIRFGMEVGPWITQSIHAFVRLLEWYVWVMRRLFRCLTAIL